MTFEDDYKEALKASSEHWKNPHMPDEDYERFYPPPDITPAWSCLKKAFEYLIHKAEDE